MNAGTPHGLTNNQPAQSPRRTVFFVSESTGITAETLGQSLLSQFDGVEFEEVYMPYINTEARARALTVRMQEASERDGARPICVATMLDQSIGEIVRAGNCFYIEVFEHFVLPLGAELGMKPSREPGRSHAITKPSYYTKRIEAINFAMNSDDGMKPGNFRHADVILSGVSRSGKTPTCLYLAMHYGLRAANYPITEPDLERGDLPEEVREMRAKLFGLTIDAQRLQRIREERRPGSDYASLRRCQLELRVATDMFKGLKVPVLNTTSQSIEEIAAQILRQLKNTSDNGD
ncbi:MULTISPECIES: pyruvate, water dikinase regulatory protein [Thiorhodovibrio]|uniref:pyruvate, water dikinase regulatory protein n=1 Tax=Thiorhodovibrio TaxID=61593 RepID=UPI0019132DCC|nr:MULTISPECIES: pyruvate, water dikinase regulatory protein [Thiorhodovibrio]MBK5969666.1 phosphoenolpyruvate synthase regulatory protein [Thiorhodovibrio winogradskyi]WPL14519.1 Phosphoenolpyruvate synthase regulatory protein [Thiorhodovibrio litoralis]